jgi:plastocyanin
MTPKYIAALALVLLIAAGCSKTNDSAEQQQNNTETKQDTEQNANVEDVQVATELKTETNASGGTFSSEEDIAPVAQPEVVEVKMTADGFSPSTVTIQRGDYVQFTNDDTKAHWPASGPHPSHSALPSFDALKGIAPGANYRYQFMTKGTFNFHDHLNPSLFGKVIVE